MSKERNLLERIRQLEFANSRLQTHASEESHSRLMAEEALSVTGDRLQLALDAAGLASWEWSHTQELIFTSAHFGRMLDGGVDASDQQDLHWLPHELMSLVLPQDAPALRRAIAGALKSRNNRFQAEFRLQSPEGLLWIECIGRVLARDSLGRAERMIGINRNITQHKIAELAIHQAREQAVAANLAKDEFLAHIGHEIRTPLNDVIGMNHLLAQTELAAEQRKYVDLIANSGRALMALVNDVLDYSRNEAGGLVLSPVRFPLKRWIREAMMPLQASAQSKGLEFQIHTAARLPKEMVGDPERLCQIVTHLVSNAIKFTAAGSVTVNMAIQGDQLLISVQDTGIGIAHEKQQAIFDAFVQADNSASRLYGGTGLGLAISIQLAHAMGGQITLQSTLDQGSRFELAIPLSHSASDQQDVINQEMGSPSSHTQTFRPSELQPEHATEASNPTLERSYAGQSALVADDHEDNRLLICTMLEQLGFAVTWVEDGHQAIDSVLSQKFDVIFMAIEMPNLNGWQATHELRQWEQQAKRARVPIIALAANASAADREHAFRMGMDAFLTTPLAQEALAAALSNALVIHPSSSQQIAPATAVHAAPQGIASVLHIANGPLQRDRVLSRLKGNEAALRELARSMRRDLREYMGLAYNAMQAKNWGALHAQANKLEGALSSITAIEAAEQAKLLAQCNAVPQAQAAFALLSVQAKLVFDALKEW